MTNALHRLAAAAAIVAATPLLAADGRVGKERPITREWTCANGRIVLINFHPRRPKEEAWLTYLGNRVAVTRQPVASGIAYASADGKVRWHEKGNDGNLEFAGLLDAPLACSRKPNK
jgi:hypothetical protein